MLKRIAGLAARYWVKARICRHLATGLLGAGLTLGLSPEPVTAATADGALEHEIKAAMLYKFLSYIEWPDRVFDESTSAYRLWVLKADEIEAELRRITATRFVHDRAIRVLRASSAARINGPHVVFVGRRAENSLPLLVELARDHCLLIVTENQSGPPPGSGINLRLVDGRMGFDVSLPDPGACEMKLSSRLLSVATTVSGGDR